MELRNKNVPASVTSQGYYSKFQFIRGVLAHSSTGRKSEFSAERTKNHGIEDVIRKMADSGTNDLSTNR